MTKAGEKLYGDWNRASGIDPDAPMPEPAGNNRAMGTLTMLALGVATVVAIGWPLYRLLTAYA